LPIDFILSDDRLTEGDESVDLNFAVAGVIASMIPFKALESEGVPKAERARGVVGTAIFKGVFALHISD
jgi:hypothetical protein